MREFWNSEITVASWLKLQELNKEFRFTLIGGWAVYLYTKLQKSRDIDIVVDYTALREIGSRYRLEKNERLSKYEVKMDLFDVDIYLPKYSRLALPVDQLMGRYATKLEGFNVPNAEALMILKLAASLERSASQKGDKDSIDIIGLLFYSGIDIKKMRQICEEQNIENRVGALLDVLNGFKNENLDYLNLNVASFSKLKHKYADILHKNL